MKLDYKHLYWKVNRFSFNCPVTASTCKSPRTSAGVNDLWNTFLFHKTRLCSLIAYISDSQWSRGWQLPIHYCEFLSSMMTWWHSTFIGIGKMAENCWSSINPAEAETIQHWVVHFPSWNPNKLLFRTSVDSNWSSTTPIEWFFFSTLSELATLAIPTTG